MQRQVLQPEQRERSLDEAIKVAEKLLALFDDETHDQFGSTMNGLKCLMEISDVGRGALSVILVDHSRLQVEEIDHRIMCLVLEGLGKDTGRYLDWLLLTCLANEIEPDDIVDAGARIYLCLKN